MAIKIKKDKEFIYASHTGLVLDPETKTADKIYKELKRHISGLEKSLLKKGLLTRRGEKINALKVWFEFGKLLNRIADKYNIIDTQDEEFFWRSIYDHVSSIVQRGSIPKRSKNWKHNHFRLCALMSKERSWKKVKEIGNWSIWRDIFDNKKILEDERLFNWTIGQIRKLRSRGAGHKKIRLFLYVISRRFRNIDTKILTSNELRVKLQNIKINKQSK